MVDSVTFILFKPKRKPVIAESNLKSNSVRIN